MINIEKHSLEMLFNKEASFKILAGDTYEAGKTERRKIYLIKDCTSFLYVGEANTSLKERFNRGFIPFRYWEKNSKARNGYKGYKWISHCKEKQVPSLTVYVAIFDEGYDQDRAFIEAVEGELVWLIREKTGSWPLCQNEIHFSNVPAAGTLAEEIYTVTINN